jgi:hypothetical protein
MRCFIQVVGSAMLPIMSLAALQSGEATAGSSLLATPVQPSGACAVRAPDAATARLGIARVVTYRSTDSRRRVSVHVDPQNRPRFLAASTMRPARADGRQASRTSRVAATFTTTGAVATGAWWDAPPRGGTAEQHRFFSQADSVDARRLAGTVLTRCLADV